MFFFRLSYSSDKNPGDYSLFVLFFVNYKDLLYCKIKRLETPSYSVENSFIVFTSPLTLVYALKA